MWGTLCQHASRHALFYVIAMGLGLQAFGTAFYDNFYVIAPPSMEELGWWQVVALVLKSTSFAVGIVVGYLIKSPNETKNENSVPSSTPAAAGK